MGAEYARQQLHHAAGFLPKKLRLTVTGLPERLQSEIEEIRLRIGRPMTVVVPDREIQTGSIVGAADLELTLEIASQSSVYTVANQIKHGFVSLKGGHRLGVCGTGVTKGGEISMVRQISSLALRIAREFPGAALPILEELQEEGHIKNTLILSPPGKGKTTLLRDMIRCISDGQGIRPKRVGVADERGELAAMFGGEPQMNIGARTDVMDGCAKAAAILMLLRGMNPEVIAVDEITSPEDIEAIKAAAGCGVTLLATAHAEKMEDLDYRPVYRELVKERIFQRAVIIEMKDGKRCYRAKGLGET